MEVDRNLGRGVEPGAVLAQLRHAALWLVYRFLEPLRKEVESIESVVIHCWASLFWEMPDVDAGAS